MNRYYKILWSLTKKKAVYAFLETDGVTSTLCIQNQIIPLSSKTVERAYKRKGKSKKCLFFSIKGIIVVHPRIHYKKISASQFQAARI